MRFAMVCNDRYQSVFQAFVAAGWHPVKLFSQPLDNRTGFNRDAIAYAQTLGIEIQLSPMTQADLGALGSAGCETLVIAEYGQLIPDWRPFIRHAVNFHPSPLPEGRGRYPVVRAILEGRREWAITCHKISDQFDRGDILASEVFPLGPEEVHESLDIKLQFAAKMLAGRVATNFAELWAGAKPQGEGSYWRMFSEADRTLDFDEPVDALLRRIRAFGELETIAHLARMTLYVRRASGWVEAHAHRPDTLVYRNHPALVIAASDGYICVYDWSLFPREAAFRSGSRAC